MTLWWLGDMGGAISHQERACAAFRRRPDPAWAAGVALRLSFHHRAHLASGAAAAGWLARATRLIEEAGLDDLRGELVLIRACVTDDPAGGEASTVEALELAGARATSSAPPGGFAPPSGSPSATACRSSTPSAARSTYGGVLVATGDWSRAEEELNAALALSRGSVPAYHAQGARDARGAAPGAGPDRERAPRGAARPGGDRPGPTRDGAERGRALTELGAALGCQVACARGERLRGHALPGTDREAARRHLDAALSELARLGMPLEAARTLPLLAEPLDGQEAARAEARVALAAFERLGAGRDADAAAALLRRLGVSARRARGLAALTKRELEVLALIGEGPSNPEIAKRSLPQPQDRRAPGGPCAAQARGAQPRRGRGRGGPPARGGGRRRVRRGIGPPRRGVHPRPAGGRGPWSLLIEARP